MRKELGVCYYKNSTHVIYEWNPCTICKIDEDKKELSVVDKIEMPNLFKQLSDDFRKICNYNLKCSQIDPSLNFELSNMHRIDVFI